MTQVACFSVATMDTFPQQNRRFPGGNALNQAIRFSRMGHTSAFVGALGTDESGDRIAALLRTESVDASHTHRINGNTATNQIVNDDAGERYGVEGTWKGGVYEGFQLTLSDWEFLAGFDIWTTHADCPSYGDALARKGDRQLMAVDFLHLTDYDLLKRSLAAVDIAYFGGTADMADDLAHIARANPRSTIVLTLGNAGSIAFQRDDTYTQPALPIASVTDTTGCGDAFQAGFTASYFETRDIRASLLAGAESGREAAGHYGGTEWPQPETHNHTTLAGEM